MAAMTEYQVSAFGDELRRLRLERGLSYRGLAEIAHYGKSYLEDLEKGRKLPSPGLAGRLDQALHAGGRLGATLRAPSPDEAEAEIEALELARRVSASDVSPETLDRIELAFDSMAMAYATTPPEILLPRVRRHLGYVGQLLDGRKTLGQYEKIIVIGSWFSLLRATLHIDLRQGAAAEASLRTAADLAGQVGHREVVAWCFETRAWDRLTAGDYRQALELSQHAQSLAPADGSAIVQATAQEGRAWARLGDSEETRHTLERVNRLADCRAVPDHPEHHYRYDPAKAHAYAATTLAWAGDPAAESVAREVIAELESEGARPRRIASAQLDLGLALLAADRPDEAAAAATEAITSGRIVPSNWWRAREVVVGVANSGAPEAARLREVAEEFRPASAIG
jgi:transcriptional regulator with XRE-family HTH domain